ncbi:DUF6415 family natural product biosynthesis protein [Streptomyces sp. NPDC093250]|uniref:DUF6415 family natural product biosynthesis protein n=1 Tax=Streptomyces sp. NPDC093250 TaxID=3366036 RepID=UPI00380E3B43
MDPTLVRKRARHRLGAAPLLDSVRRWRPLDDVAAALDDVPPAQEGTEELAEQLCGHLSRLVTIAVATEAERDTVAAQLIERARKPRAEGLPGDQWETAGHLRRLGWTANELHEQLGAIQCLKKAA